MNELLTKLLHRKDLDIQEAYEMILWIMSEEAVAVQASAMLVLLQVKGVTDDEMADLEALAMRATRSAKCIPTDRALWPEICEERMGRNLTKLKALVAELEVA